MQTTDVIGLIHSPRAPFTLGHELVSFSIHLILGEEELAVEVVQEGGFEGETAFRATIVVRGQTYEAVGKNKNIAKIRAAKKALEVIRPKKDSTDSDLLNAEGVDISRHPTMVSPEGDKSFLLSSGLKLGFM